MTDRLLADVFAPDVVEAIERLVDERVAVALVGFVPTTSPRWLTVAEAATRLGCSPDAVRMRARRGRLEVRRHGRSLYISSASVESLGRAP